LVGAAFLGNAAPDSLLVPSDIAKADGLIIRKQIREMLIQKRGNLNHCRTSQKNFYFYV